MPLLLAAFALDIALAALILRMIVQSRRYSSLPIASGRTGNAEDWPAVAVIVPARDEATSIAGCVRGLLAQDYPSDKLSLRVVDDGSRDGTACLAAEAAGDDPRVRILAADAVASGWTGKSHAISAGVGDLERSDQHVDFLCFVDADTVAEPDLIRTAVAHARQECIDMLSLGPRQELGTWAERLVMPCGLFLVAASQDVGRLNAPDRPEAAANGQFLLFRCAAYERLGGHAAVRAEICEDTALARRAKAHGLRFALLGAETLIRTRMYRSPAALWSGLSKNVTELGGGPGRTALIAQAGFAFVLAVPTLAALCLAAVANEPSLINVMAAGLAWAGLFAVVGLHFAGTRHFRIPLGYGLLFPLGYGLCLALALDGARQARLGRVCWKGRTYAGTRAAGESSAETPSQGHADA